MAAVLILDLNISKAAKQVCDAGGGGGGGQRAQQSSPIMASMHIFTWLKLYSMSSCLPINRRSISQRSLKLTIDEELCRKVSKFLQGVLDIVNSNLHRCPYWRAVMPSVLPSAGQSALPVILFSCNAPAALPVIAPPAPPRPHPCLCSLPCDCVRLLSCSWHSWLHVPGAPPRPMAVSVVPSPPGPCTNGGTAPGHGPMVAGRG